MITPKIYKKELLANKVSMEMLGEVLYSYNKRAKNYRDKAREYSHWRHCDYDYEGQSRFKMDCLYSKKDKLLKLIKPIAIHKVIRTNYRKVFDWDYEFYELSKIEDVDYFIDRKGDYHEFCYETFEKIEYYLYYEVGNFSFHSPINEKDIDKYPELAVSDIGDLITEGKDVQELLSLQFCDKVYNGLMDGSIKICSDNIINNKVA